MFLKTNKTHIVLNGKRVTLKGFNVGGWLMMEGYILHSRNIAEQVFKKEFVKERGKKDLAEFERSFRNSFITENDFKAIADMDFNCVRVPFNSRLIEKAPFRYSEDGVKYLDEVVRWAKKYKIWVILDMHAACQPQSCDWHADSLGRAVLWESDRARQRTIALWEFLADRYKDEPSVAGYDLLNEPVLPCVGPLNSFYEKLIKRIRKVDKNHILFVEGKNWAMDVEDLIRFDDDQMCVSIHFYIPLEFTFNLIPFLTYPLESSQGRFSRPEIEKWLSRYEKFSQERQRPIHVGEFGVNARQGFYGEGAWLKDTLSVFDQMGFHWSYWTYKAIKNSIFPDGVFSYLNNPLWVNRQGPKMGCEMFAELWPRHKREMACSWGTQHFKENTEVSGVLRSFA